MPPPQVIARVHALEVALGGLDPELDFHGAALQLPRALEPGLEDPEHLAVLEEHLTNRSMPTAAARCKPLEQTGADSASLEVVRDDEGDLGGRRIAQADTSPAR